MKDKIQPLHYAIMKEFLDGRARSSKDVIESLSLLYSSSKLFTIKDVSETLATAKENGVLEEAGYYLDRNKELVIQYKITPFGKSMIERYLG